MAYSCCAIKCMVCYEFPLLSSHVKNTAANQRLQREVSCWLCFLGQKGGGYKGVQRQYSLLGERKEKARVMCMHTYEKHGLMYFSLYKIYLSSTNFKNSAPAYSTSAPLAARLKLSSIISLFNELILLNLRGRDFQPWFSTVEGRNIFATEKWDFQAFVKSILWKTLK